MTPWKPMCYEDWSSLSGTPKIIYIYIYTKSNPENSSLYQKNDVWRYQKKFDLQTFVCVSEILYAEEIILGILKVLNSGGLKHIHHFIRDKSR